METKPKYCLTKVYLPKSGEVKMYFSPKVASALREVSEDMTLYMGVRLGTLLEAVYSQGMKDGARKAFEEVGRGFLSAQKLVPHKNPGKPAKK